MIVNGTNGPVQVFSAASLKGRKAGSELRSAGGDSFYREILLMSLFYLIEEHNRVGVPWNSFERLACLLDVIPDTLHWGERLIGEPQVN